MHYAKVNKTTTNEKNNYGIYFMISVLIGACVLVVTDAEDGQYHYTTNTIERTKVAAGSTERGVEYADGLSNSGDHGSETTNQGGSEPVLRVEGFPLDSQATNIINYAYEVSNGDMDFVLTLKAENGGFDMYKQSGVPDIYGPNGREDSWGLCQLHRNRHKDIVDTKEFRDSWKYQVEICYKKYNTGTKFYGYNVRERYRNLFYWE